MPQLTVDLNTHDGAQVEERNRQYRELTSSIRKTANAETQTRQIYLKTKATVLGRQKRFNKGTIVNNWVLFDTYQDIEQAEAEFETKLLQVCGNK